MTKDLEKWRPWMREINSCCGARPVVWKCECRQVTFCGCDVEKIECATCGRVIYGVDPENIKDWNRGGNDD